MKKVLSIVAFAGLVITVYTIYKKQKSKQVEIKIK